MIKLKKETVEWAVNHLFSEGDTDLFPVPLEINILNELKNEVIDTLKDVELSYYRWKPARRFIIPKSEFAYRVATQLDPIDNIILTGIIYEYGQLIEDRRIPILDEMVFSYRFNPNDNRIYSNNYWENWWKSCSEISKNYNYVIMLDISDFYNQIYSHTIETELIACKFPNQVIKSILNLQKYLTSKNSRGIPIGPHSTHLLAEMTLIPIDESLKLNGYPFKRYSDDYFIFCNTQNEYRIIINKFANILDKQQRLIIQKHKLKILTQNDFLLLSEQMLQDNPINEFELEIINIIKKHSLSGPYSKISINNISAAEINIISKDKVESIIKLYLSKNDPNYSRLRWFYRRLSQLGLPVALEYSINNFFELLPVISDLCNYIISIDHKYFNEDWKAIGNKVICLLENDLVKSNEFYQISLLSLFSRNIKLNNLDKLLKLYNSSSGSIKRKISLAAYTSNSSSWFKEHKEEYAMMDSWNKRAMIIGSKHFQPDERRFFFSNYNNSIAKDDFMEIFLKKWACK